MLVPSFNIDLEELVSVSHPSDLARESARITEKLFIIQFGAKLHPGRCGTRFKQPLLFLPDLRPSSSP